MALVLRKKFVYEYLYQFMNIYIQLSQECLVWNRLCRVMCRIKRSVSRTFALSFLMRDIFETPISFESYELSGSQVAYKLIVNKSEIKNIYL